ncbi:hypothetical protein C2S53_014602 [Perilla frutescens var. hirtella]|uniref:Uncharacterized protein n=1 Tax=Perilla frutescens var. hirtella TaxID=608512 RepID=A0AAD4IVI7_PERFH|nr:hypothetical protein C2S53_014602 [Perilla frutescens var. hirtella]
MEIEAMAVGTNGAATNTVSLSHDEWSKHEGPVPTDHDNSGLTRHWFPADFIFGWKITDGSNGTLACDMYNRYKEDIKMMKQMGFDSYRFSISWSRILPGGRCNAGINSEGIDYYNGVINTVLEHDMKPFVTLFHWDLPLCLEKEYGGFLSKRVKDDFREFAEVCFWAFGDRVKSWSTLNEPWTYAVNGYVTGKFAPGRKVPGSNDILDTKIALYRSLPVLLERSAGDKTTVTALPSEAYTVARNLLLAHAEAVHLYRTKFQEAQQGKIGIVLCSHWFYAFNEESEADRLAVKRALDFMLGWFLEPVLYGHYPKNMINYVPPDNLASFTPHEIEKLRGSLDFLGLNYYTTEYVSDDPYPTEAEGYAADQKLKFSSERNGQFIGTPSGSSWLFSVPKGIYAILTFLNKEYGPELKEIYITENGWSTKNDFTKTAKMVCDDDENRTKYFQDHLANILKSMKDEECSRHGLFKKLKGYFLWSWCDNYEWSEGYTARFGLVYVDYMNELTRYPKNSAAWIAKFLKSKEKPPRCDPWLFNNKRSMIEDNDEIETSANKRLKLVETTTPDQ